MLSKKQKQAIFDRLRVAMNGMSRAELSNKMGKCGFPLSVNSLSAYSSGTAAPTSETLIGFNKVLGVSIDWLLTGREPEPPGIEQLKKMIDAATVEKGFALRDLDSDLAKIMEVLIDLQPQDRAPLAAMVEAYVNQRRSK